VAGQATTEVFHMSVEKETKQMTNNNFKLGNSAEPTTAAMVSKSQFAKLLGLSRGRISQLIRLGLPVAADGRIPAADAYKWYCRNVRMTIVNAARLAELTRKPR